MTGPLAALAAATVALGGGAPAAADFTARG
jgi:hypothetical protein